MGQATIRERGILTRIWQGVFGEPDSARRELKRATSHGAFMLALARAWSIPLMLFFSVGALVTLGGVPLQHNLALWQAGAPLDWVELAGLAVTVVFVVGMDVAMIVAAIKLRDAQTRGAGVGETLGLWLIILAVGALEATTFILMVQGYEHPSTPGAWALLAGRGVMAPIIAIFLSLSGERPVSRRDVQHLLQVRAGEGLLNWLERTLAGETAHEADMAQLFGFFALVNGATDDQRAWDTEVMQTMERMAPASVRALAQREVETANAAAAAAQADSRRQIETAQRQVAEANAASVSRASDALLSLLTTGALPDWLITQRPDLAGLTLDSLLAGRAGGNVGGGSTTRRGRGAGGVTPIDQSRAGRQRTFLAGLDIQPPTAPQGKRGVWLRASDLTALTGGKSGSETPQALVRRLGESAMVGRSLVAPFEPVMRELSERHLLTDVAQSWWNTQTSGSESSDSGDDAEGDSGEMGAVGRGNITPLRA